MPAPSQVLRAYVWVNHPKLAPCCIRVLSWVCACLRRWIIVRLARSAPRPTGQIKTPIVKGLSDTAEQKRGIVQTLISMVPLGRMPA